MRFLLPILSIGLFTCEAQEINQSEYADVVSVKTSGGENDYIFNVGIASPDTGCNQYADWWEVASEDGELIYRRILAHSHVNEQPFIRSGGKVKIRKDEVIVIRVHMNTSGYGGLVFRGTVEDGFEQVKSDKNFAIDLEKKEPLPLKCAF